VDCGLILGKDRGLFIKLAGIIFQWKKGMDSVHSSWTTAPDGAPWTKDSAMAGSSPELDLRPLSGTGVHRRRCNRERGARGIHLGPH
jgi:hypothetical protein